MFPSNVTSYIHDEKKQAKTGNVWKMNQFLFSFTGGMITRSDCMVTVTTPFHLKSHIFVKLVSRSCPPQVMH